MSGPTSQFLILSQPERTSKMYCGTWQITLFLSCWIMTVSISKVDFMTTIIATCLCGLATTCLSLDQPRPPAAQGYCQHPTFSTCQHSLQDIVSRDVNSLKLTRYNKSISVWHFFIFASVPKKEGAKPIASLLLPLQSSGFPPTRFDSLGWARWSLPQPSWAKTCPGEEIHEFPKTSYSQWCYLLVD